MGYCWNRGIHLYVSSYADFRSFSPFLSLRRVNRNCTWFIAFPFHFAVEEKWIAIIVLAKVRQINSERIAARERDRNRKSGPPVQPSSSCPPWFFRKRSMHSAWRVNRRKNHMALFAALPSFISLISVFLRLPQTSFGIILFPFGS